MPARKTSTKTARRKPKEDSRGKKIITSTGSICPECLRILKADIFERDGKIWIEKTCSRHGRFEELYWGSSKMYRKAKKFASDGKGIENPNVTKENPICPKDCGLCSIHKSQTALANVVVTNRCDLSCWYCFFYAKRMGYVYEPTLDDIDKMVKTLVDERPVPCNAVQLTGGEPTLREDVVDMVKICKKHGIEHIQLNTNGIRLSTDLDFMRKVKEAGVKTLYLSFDGVTPKTNPKNHWEIPGVLEKSRKVGGLGSVLVPTIIKGINDHEIGDILKFGFRNNDVVRGVNFQPVSLVGKISHADRRKMRITIPDVIQKMEDQTEGQITKDDFYPVPTPKALTRFVEALTGEAKYELSSHFACGMATYIFNDNGKMLPITRFVDVDGMLEYLNEKADGLESGSNKYLTGIRLLFKLGSFIDNSKAPKGFSLKKILYRAIMKHDYRALGDFHDRSLFVGMMHFQDKFNYDIERVKRCTIHYTLSDGRIIPFCAFNVIPEWYRDKDMESQGISFEKWEKRSGTKMKDDLYRRDVNALASSEIYRKTYGV